MKVTFSPFFSSERPIFNSLSVLTRLKLVHLLTASPGRKRSPLARPSSKSVRWATVRSEDYYAFTSNPNTSNSRAWYSRHGSATKSLMLMLKYELKLVDGYSRCVRSSTRAGPQLPSGTVQDRPTYGPEHPDRHYCRVVGFRRVHRSRRWLLTSHENATL